ncbi:bifunctional protein-disulfide isomerase/oxidoreductase DsbC [Colwellia psychrerythraea]|uniref:Thiol:disulfide interchange protein n=1 Tax=Colwellia psychrerythraea TaxID=28229 RepID=A0A099KK49_COLPS|nr:bifunctional protein-disulfide isomerase/oxidoreductase DsbC [Colwellia psychrerythraea]KGJ91174.1 Thioredoxin-like fold-containing protein [Colwellia psychrerythraea]
MTNFHLKNLLIVLGLASINITITSYASDSNVIMITPVKATINTNTSKLSPALVNDLKRLGIKVNSVSNNVTSGLKELITDKGVMYISADGKYLIKGSVIEIKSRTNITTNAIKQLRAEAVSKNHDSTIIYKSPSEKFSVTIFTDITCGYCRKLHHEIDDYLAAGVTIRYMAYPRYGLKGSGFSNLANIWCSDDPQKALTAAKLNKGKHIKPVENCKSPVKAHYNAGKSFGIRGTPAIILDDGTLIAGYKSAPALLSILKKSANKLQ